MEPRKPFMQNTYMRYSTLAFQMLATIGIFTFGGYKLDQHFEMKTPIWTISLALVGVGISLYSVIKDFAKPQK